MTKHRSAIEDAPNQKAPDASVADAYREYIPLLYTLADDELVAGHRASEWLGLAPSVEEDIAFASLAQDEIGHARFYYELLHHLGEPTPDHLVYRRQATHWRNSRLLERARGDFAEAVVRQWMYDTWDAVRLEVLIQCPFPALADGVRKMQREEYYHLIHMDAWLARLSSGGEARDRLVRAVEAVFAEAADLSVLPQELSSSVSGSLNWEQAELVFHQRIEQALHRYGLGNARWSLPGPSGRSGDHSASLTELLGTLQEVSSTEEGVRW
ncbi:MAG: phenylacetate-CoA oxygenase subunit PaaC [Alicyclobacillaceae bacterium]|jgi:ring-1,2-phenylacetyl-CoA epoxidase subunit PaaC|nr:phenylacetate-CoA oxygenase subunit PaaC [Alicyclobacillaceae bacterium]MCY0896620.1 phenylacetate-CoA oxygenase subunit PaaC [Alicyclobacillaceae bacterium]